jgi:heptosyltransferase-2
LAETWPSTRSRRALLAVADMLGRAVTAPFRRRENEPGASPIRRILVIEPWNIGDVILTTPLLRALRQRYPAATISLLAREYAQTLLAGSGLVDEVIVADLPWTASRNKYPLRASAAKRMRDLIGVLRRKKFDATIDARMDVRSNSLAALTKAKYRLGYSIGGGGWLLTLSLPSNRRNTHKVSDWLDLLALLPDGSEELPTVDRIPRLKVSDAETSAAASRLGDGKAPPSPVIGYHPGGSHAAKRWPLGHFEHLVYALREAVSGTHIIFLGPDDVPPPGLPNGAVVRRPTLRELMAEIACCDVLVCNDSGPMHIADALGVPVVAVFEIGNPQWYGPSGPKARVISGELAGLGISAAPLDRPPANPVPVERVAEAVQSAIGFTHRVVAGGGAKP